jgi:hypothetical protein
MRTEYLTIDDVRVCFYDFCNMRFDKILFFFYDFEVDNTARQSSAFDEDSLSILSSRETYSAVSDFIYFDSIEEFGHFMDYV